MCCRDASLVIRTLAFAAVFHESWGLVHVRKAVGVFENARAECLNLHEWSFKCIDEVNALNLDLQGGLVYCTETRHLQIKSATGSKWIVRWFTPRIVWGDLCYRTLQAMLFHANPRLVANSILFCKISTASKLMKPLRALRCWQGLASCAMHCDRFRQSSFQAIACTAADTSAPDSNSSSCAFPEKFNSQWGNAFCASSRLSSCLSSAVCQHVERLMMRLTADVNRAQFRTHLTN